MIERRCGNCIFWEQIDAGEDYGMCRRYPPTPFPDVTINDDSAMGGNSEFPVVDKRDWCGEIKLRGNDETLYSSPS